MRSTLRARVRRLGLVALIVVAFGAAFAAPASAHAALLSSTPAKNSSVPALSEVRLVFSENLRPALVKVQIRDAAGARHESPAPPQVTGATVRQAAAPGLKPGPYTIVYRVVSDDGHPVTGVVPFTLTGSAGSTGAAPAAPATDQAAATASDGTKRWLMLGGGLLFGILLGLSFVLLRKPPRQEPSSGE